VRRNEGVVIAKMRVVGAVPHLHERNQPRPGRLSVFTEVSTWCKTPASACNTQIAVSTVQLPRGFIATRTLFCKLVLESQPPRSYPARLPRRASRASFSPYAHATTTRIDASFALQRARRAQHRQLRRSLNTVLCNTVTHVGSGCGGGNFRRSREWRWYG
jgi:hypothetical protein